MQTNYFPFYFAGLPETSVSENVTAEETAAICSGHGSVINKEKFDRFEMMFNMDKGACKVAQENLENSKQKQKSGEEEQTQSGRASKDKTRDNQTGTKTDGSDAPCPPPDTGKTGLAPWQDGVLERLGQELTPQEYTMYMVHHGRMLLSFGQIEACTPRERDFVYGSLEPIPVQTLRSFKVRPSNWIQSLRCKRLGTNIYSDEHFYFFAIKSVFEGKKIFGWMFKSV